MSTPVGSCGCCSSGAAATPTRLDLRPGLSHLPFRVGTHGRFKAAMLAALSGQSTLRRLGTRRDEDPTIGLLDAWAVVLDVLAFYQERIANEAFLRTATERRSLLELARLIGYELGPGVAAEVLLAFTLDGAKGSPERLTIEAGTRVQSVPSGPDELPQSFETRQPLPAKAPWNVLHPRPTAPQVVGLDSTAFYFQDVATGLRRGDRLLVVAGEGDGEQRLLRVHDVEPQPAADRTLVRCGATASPPVMLHDPGLDEPAAAPVAALFRSAGGRDALRSATRVAAAHRATATQSIGGQSIAGATLIAAAEDAGWSRRQLVGGLASLRRPPQGGVDFAPASPGVYALRLTTAPFGHNAPAWGSLPDPIRSAFDDWDAASAWPIDRRARKASGSKGAIHLEQALPQVVADTWLVLAPASGMPGVYRVKNASQETIADFSLSGVVTRIELAAPDGSDVDHQEVGAAFPLRATAIHAVSEPLPLAELPIEAVAAGATELILDELVPDLPSGRPLLLRGERWDDARRAGTGVVTIEELTIARVEQQGSHTHLFLTPALAASYLRRSVEIFSNVVAATHGEGRVEVLGSGDAAVPYQRFVLRQSPVTHTSADVPGGAVSSVEVEVDGVRWREVPSLFGLGPKDRAYVLRRLDDGRTAVMFGDGREGQRPATGSENVVARYRFGIGRPGLVGAERLTLLATRPLGVREVTNPAPSGGAEDPETRDQARANAPLTVLTLDRVVSLRDFEDYARAFAGIAKARADWVWDGTRRVVHLTLAGSEGGPPAPHVVASLRAALDAARVPYQPLRVSPLQRLRLKVVANLLVEPDRRWETVAAAARAALEAAFGFPARELGRPLARSAVLAVLHNVPGVVAVDLEEMGEVQGLAADDGHGLPALPARFDDAAGLILPAQLVVLAQATEETVALRPLEGPR